MDDNEYISCSLNIMQTGYLTKESYRHLQSLLMKHESNYHYNVYPLCKTQITGNEIMFIADTHFGSMADSNLVSMCRNKSYDEVLNEFMLALKLMPDEINTYLQFMVLIKC